MNRAQVKQYAVRNIVKDYINGDDAGRSEIGVWAFENKLEIRPAYQREFVYNEKQQEAVIDTIMSGLPLGMFHFNKKNNDYFQVIDGQQRLISICKYVVGQEFTWNHKHYSQLSTDEKKRIDGYKLDVYEYTFETNAELVSWFRTINIAGKELNEQEILNAGYTGEWLSTAKRYFSKRNAPAAELSEGYIKASVLTQGYLTTALKYISQKNNQTVEEYMREHYQDEDASNLIRYFEKVIEWAKKVHRPVAGLTDVVDWGKLYEQYHNEYTNEELRTIAEEIDELIVDEEITNHKGLIEYVLSGGNNIKLLSLRTFDKKLIAKKYAEQNGICPICKKKYNLKDMAGDHIIPWSRGGKTVPNNLQVLCKVCNSNKADCYPEEEG